MEYPRRHAKVYNAANYQHPLCPRKLYYIPRQPEGTIRGTRNFFVRFFTNPYPTRRGSLLEMAACRIFAKFPSRSPIIAGRRMKKTFVSGGKEVRSASSHLFSWIFANMSRNNVAQGELTSTGKGFSISLPERWENFLPILGEVIYWFYSDLAVNRGFIFFSIIIVINWSCVKWIFYGPNTNLS